MCTVLFIPDHEKVTMVSLRDESPVRTAANNPRFFTEENITSIFPEDPSGGGTWVGANDKGSIIILLNGGFVGHKKQDYYARSRGQIVREMLTVSDPVNHWMRLDLSGIEPHTLVVWQFKQLFELVWDGSKTHMSTKEKESCHIWSSSTLYDDVATKKRSDGFMNWINANTDLNPSTLTDFLRSFRDEQNGFFINRNEVVKTLSMTYLVHTEKQIEFKYQDFRTQVNTDWLLKLNPTEYE